MNPSFEAFVARLQMGSTINPEPLRKAKDNFHRQRLVWRVNPECNFLLLQRPPKKLLFGFGRFKNGGFSERLKKNKAAEKYFWGVEKVILPPNTITRRRRKKKKKTRFFRLGAEKYCSLGARRKSRFLVLGAEKTKKPPKKKNGGRKKIGGAEIVLGGVEKVIWPPNTITRRRRKKNIYISAWAPKNTTLGRVRSKGLATFFRGLREPFR